MKICVQRWNTQYAQKSMSVSCVPICTVWKLIWYVASFIFILICVRQVFRMISLMFWTHNWCNVRCFKNPGYASVTVSRTEFHYKETKNVQFTRSKNSYSKITKGWTHRSKITCSGRRIFVDDVCFPHFHMPYSFYPRSHIHYE